MFLCFSSCSAPPARSSAAMWTAIAPSATAGTTRRRVFTLASPRVNAGDLGCRCFIGIVSRSSANNDLIRAMLFAHGYRSAQGYIDRRFGTRKIMGSTAFPFRHRAQSRGHFEPLCLDELHFFIDAGLYRHKAVAGFICGLLQRSRSALALLEINEYELR